VLAGAFIVMRSLASSDARDPGVPPENASAMPPLAAPVASPVEKHAAPPRVNDDGVSVLRSQHVPDDPSLDIDIATARAERWEVRAALELRDLRRAIDVGNRAVRHDPSQADGWLLLAAAHLDLHDEHAANRALASCAKLATHGPRGECIALLPPDVPHP
jgi:hypothetical protein